MAEMNEAGRSRKGAGGKRTHLSTRVDLTPMVDLGFLLITFFIFTTTMAQPKAMELNMPYDPAGVDVPPTTVKHSTVLTLIPVSAHEVLYYEGMPYDNGNPAVLHKAGFTQKDNIRDVLLAKNKRVTELVRSGALKPSDKTTVLIKPDPSSHYDDFVRILDEMTINGIEVYAVVDLSDADRALMQR